MQLRERLDDWIEETHDPGPESEAMYDSEMAVYLKTKQTRDSEQAEILRRNITQMKTWAAEGK